MKSIMLTYPGFQTLPRGLKQMLIASESDFFTTARPAPRVVNRRVTVPLPTSRSRPNAANWPESNYPTWKN